MKLFEMYGENTSHVDVPDVAATLASFFVSRDPTHHYRQSMAIVSGIAVVLLLSRSRRTA